MNQDSKGFSRIDADNLVRLLNLFYQRTVAYAFDHPVAQETIPRVYEAFQKCLGHDDSLSLLFQDSGYYIGHVDLVYAPNNRKIADHLRRFGIESITFTSPVTINAMARFLDACSLTHADAARFLAYLANQGFEIAMVRYRHAFQSIYWFLRCTFGKNNEEKFFPRSMSRFVAWYHRSRPKAIERVEATLNLVAGKDMVHYGRKPAGPSTNGAYARDEATQGTRALR